VLQGPNGETAIFCDTCDERIRSSEHVERLTSRHGERASDEEVWNFITNASFAAIAWSG